MFQEKSLKTYLADLGYEKIISHDQSGPKLGIPIMVAQLCKFCYFKTTKTIALFGQAADNIYHVYYALDDVTESAKTNENYIVFANEDIEKEREEDVKRENNEQF